NAVPGSHARHMALKQNLKDQPALLAAAKNGNPGDNQTALAIAGLESANLASLSGTTIKGTYQAMINGVAVDAATAQNNADATKAVQDTLDTQREALSGVSLDEEAINLMR